jgi:hypothetical protein
MRTFVVDRGPITERGVTTAEVVPTFDLNSLRSSVTSKNFNPVMAALSVMRVVHGSAPGCETRRIASLRNLRNGTSNPSYTRAPKRRRPYRASGLVLWRVQSVARKIHCTFVFGPEAGGPAVNLGAGKQPSIYAWIIDHEGKWRPCTHLRHRMVASHIFPPRLNRRPRKLGLKTGSVRGRSTREP